MNLASAKSMRMDTRPSGPIMGYIGLLCLGLAFVYPGARLFNIPVSIVSVISIGLFPLGLLAYSQGRRMLIILSFLALFFLFSANTFNHDLQIRDWLYLSIPTSAVGAVALVKALFDNYPPTRIARWVTFFCGFNAVLMVGQALDFFDMNEELAWIWESNISFVTDNPYEQIALLNTMYIRPPGMFPTCIIASTFLYVCARGVFLISGRWLALVFACVSIILAANRTLAATLIAFEFCSFAWKRGLLKTYFGAFVSVALGLLAWTAASRLFPELYFVQFVNEELLGGAIWESSSILERQKTFLIFRSLSDEYSVFGGLSTTTLEALAHVFDSELMLRLLQFGAFGYVALLIIILSPRTGRPDSQWAFLFVVAIALSFTSTFATGVIFTFAIAFYKEAVVRRVDWSQLRLPSALPHKSEPKWAN